jgi:hypothetical protein
MAGLWDGLVSESRRQKKGIPYEQYRTKVTRSSKSRYLRRYRHYCGPVLAAVGAIFALVAKFAIVVERANSPDKTY